MISDLFALWPFAFGLSLRCIPDLKLFRLRVLLLDTLAEYVGNKRRAIRLPTDQEYPGTDEYPTWKGGNAD